MEWWFRSEESNDHILELSYTVLWHSPYALDLKIILRETLDICKDGYFGLRVSMRIRSLFIDVLGEFNKCVGLIFLIGRVSFTNVRCANVESKNAICLMLPASNDFFPLCSTCTAHPIMRMAFGSVLAVCWLSAMALRVGSKTTEIYQSNIPVLLGTAGCN